MLVSELVVTAPPGSDSRTARSSTDDGVDTAAVDDGVDISAVDDDGTDTPRSSALHDKPIKATTAAATPEIERAQPESTMAQTVAATGVQRSDGLSGRSTGDLALDVVLERARRNAAEPPDLEGLHLAGGEERLHGAAPDMETLRRLLDRQQQDGRGRIVLAEG